LKGARPRSHSRPTRIGTSIIVSLAQAPMKVTSAAAAKRRCCTSKTAANQAASIA